MKEYKSNLVDFTLELFIKPGSKSSKGIIWETTIKIFVSPNLTGTLPRVNLVNMIEKTHETNTSHLLIDSMLESIQDNNQFAVE